MDVLLFVILIPCNAFFLVYAIRVAFVEGQDLGLG